MSHCRLVAFVEKHSFDGLTQVYAKPILVPLCRAFGISKISRLNKENLAKRLASTITTTQRFADPSVVDSRVYSVARTEIDEGSGRITMTLSVKNNFKE